MDELYRKYEKKYKENGSYSAEASELAVRVGIGALYCRETSLDTDRDELLDERLRELSGMGEELLIDCIFDSINEAIYRRRGML